MATALVASMVADMSSPPPALLPVPQRTDLVMKAIGERQGAPHARVLLHAMAVLGLLVFVGWSIF
jgi:hypothetical protein